MKTCSALFWFLCAVHAYGGTSGIEFVHQPLHTLGTDQDSELILAKVPVIVNAVPESMVRYVAHKHKLLQREPAFAEDSNILSCLGIEVGGEWLANCRHFEATIDLTEMKPAERYGVTDEEVVKAAVECVKRTILEMQGRPLWKIRIKAREADAAKWRRLETDVLPASK
ncbi:hypothetical protein [Prosthecobacter sp.]|uniref:hypothetical protein n=1 Tax=Prosthecobacter sp. TaxID=1965333 RepID=UPI002ABCB1EC|nr:hypothetical protein [Prosthecobacter sp.]MDZ4405222.1 hypothetical protein [Prosthecobacter sp.]